LRAEEQRYQAQAERKHSRQLRSAVAALALLLIGSVVASVLAVVQTTKARSAERSAIEQKGFAERARNEAEAAKSTAQVERDFAKAAKDDAIKQKGLADVARTDAEDAKEAALDQKRLADEATADAVTQTNEALKQRSIAESRRIASEATSQLKSDPELAVLLARESIQTTNGIKGVTPKAGAEALHAALQALPDRREFSISSGARPVLYTWASADGTRLVTCDSDRSIVVPMSPQLNLL
jgi:hypothetical protein